MTETAAPQGRIVVGIDGSDSSGRAFAWAIQQAKFTGASLEVVITWAFPNSYGAAIAWPDSMDFAAEAEGVLDKAIAESVPADATITLTKHVIEGHPALVLTQRAEGADLVVVGSRGHGAFAGMLLGSVSEHLATHAPCPVVIVREP